MNTSTGASPRPRAVVVGLDCITGLQTARLLARRGVSVIGIASNLSHFCARTRVCKEIVQANTASEELIEALDVLASRSSTRPVLYPCTDNSVLQISRNRARLTDRCHIALPSHDVVEMLMSKPALARHAQKHGFRVPATVDVRSREDVEAAISTLRFPCVMKPALKDSRWLSHGSMKAFKIATPDELVDTFEIHSPWSDRFIVQEWIEGSESDLYSCNCYFDKHGEAIVTFVARKVRQWPPETGTSALGVECRHDVVRDETVRLFQTVGYRGLGYVEMKVDRRTGELFLIEPNVGRPTGRSAIAEAGGVELLYSMYCDLIGAPLPGQRRQRYTQAKWVYLRHDLQAAFYRWRRAELSARAWWRSLRGPKSYAVLSATDPLPFLLDCRKALMAAGRALVAPAKQRTARANRQLPAWQTAGRSMASAGERIRTEQPKTRPNTLRQHLVRLAGNRQQRPDASIIIPVNAQGDLPTVLPLLDSLGQYTGPHSVEIILVINNYDAAAPPVEIEDFRALGVRVVATPSASHHDADVGAARFDRAPIVTSARVLGTKAARSPVTVHLDADCRVRDVAALLNWYVTSLQSGFELAYSHVGFYDLRPLPSVYLKVALHHTFRFVKRNFLGIPTTRGSNYAVDRSLFLRAFGTGQLWAELQLGPAAKRSGARILYSGRPGLTVLTSGRRLRGGWLRIPRYFSRRLRYNLNAILAARRGIPGTD